MKRILILLLLPVWLFGQTNTVVQPNGDIGETGIVFAHLSSATATTITTADTWYIFQSAFTNTVVKHFTVAADGITYQGNGGYFEVEWMTGGADNTTVKIYVRVLIDGNEARCLQANETRGRRTSDNGTMPYTGTVANSSGQELKVQYQVSSTDMDFEGASVFDNPVAFSVNFEQIDIQ